MSNETEFRYDAAGNKTKVIDALDRETDYAYDNQNRLTQVTSPSGSGNTITYEYDLLGRQTKVTDFGGTIANLVYDYMGRVVTKSIGATPTIVERRAYDDVGRLTTLYDGAGTAANYYYDANDRLTQDVVAGKTTAYYYDAAGRLTKKGASDGTVDVREYYYSGTTGLLTRMAFTNGANTDSVYFYYDGAGRKTKDVDWLGANGMEYAFDVGGRLTKMTDKNNSSQTLTYAYDASGNVTNMTDWHGNATTYTYTDTNLLSTVTAPGSKVWTYTYNALGQRTQISLPNGMTTAYGYDTRNRLTAIGHKDGSTVLDGFTYALDTGSNITKTTHEDSKYWDYLYDGRSRLTSAVKKNADNSTAATYTYTYDAGDNLVTKVEAGTTTTLAYDALKLTAMTSGGTTTNLTYDDWGRQVSKYQSGSYSATYAYRYDDKLYSVTSNFSGEGNMTNDYDGAGKLRSITAGGTTTKLRWDAGWHVINREDSGGALTDTFVNDPAFQAAGSVLAAHVGSDPSSGGTWNYMMQDIIRSTRSIRGGDKSQLGATEFTPYGGIYSSSGTDLPQKFTGHWWMPQAGMYYAPYRMYIPSQDRWNMRDPLGMADGINLYEYVGSDPIVNYDPHGLIHPLLWVAGAVGLYLLTITGILYVGVNDIQPLNNILQSCPIASQTKGIYVTWECGFCARRCVERNKFADIALGDYEKLQEWLRATDGYGCSECKEPCGDALQFAVETALSAITL